jgi:hypothetical protein
VKDVSGILYVNQTSDSSNPGSPASANIWGIVGGAAGGTIIFVAVLYSLWRKKRQVDQVKVKMLTAGRFVSNLGRLKNCRIQPSLSVTPAHLLSSAHQKRVTECALDAGRTA